MTALPPTPEIDRLLCGLFNRDVSTEKLDAMSPHPEACFGLVDNDNQLRYVIGSDLAFAHRSGAALAMIPVGAAEDAGVDDPDEDLLECYQEVANMTSRAVNEASDERVRLDPGIAHDRAAIETLIATGAGVLLDVTIAGYGNGHLGIWAAN